MNNFDLKQFLTENKLTTNSRILNESKKEEVTVVKTDWSGGLESPVVTLDNGKVYELELINQEFEDGYYMYHYETLGDSGYRFLTVGNEEDPEAIGGWEVY